MFLKITCSTWECDDGKRGVVGSKYAVIKTTEEKGKFYLDLVDGKLSHLIDKMNSDIIIERVQRVENFEPEESKNESKEVLELFLHEISEAAWNSDSTLSLDEPTWWIMTGVFSGLNLYNHYVENVVRNIVWDTAIDTTKIVATSIKLRTEWNTHHMRRIAYACCKSVILNYKKIFMKLSNSGSGVLDTHILMTDVVKACRKLLTFNVNAIKELKLMIPLQLAYFLVGIENQISFTRNFPGDKDYLELMDEHAELMERLSDVVTKEIYLKLFAPAINFTELSLMLTLPKVLVEIIHAYLGMDLQDAKDVEEIHKRLLLIPELQIV